MSGKTKVVLRSRVNFMIEAQIWYRRAPNVLNDLALLKKRQLLPEEQILSYKSAGEMDGQGVQP
jgi:hypothetical protein